MMGRWRDSVTHRAGHHVYTNLEATPDISRGEERFAAEVAIAELTGQLVPTWARSRADRILEVMARG